MFDNFQGIDRRQGFTTFQSAKLLEESQKEPGIMKNESGPKNQELMIMTTNDNE